MRVGVIQLCSGVEVDANIEASSRLIRRAAHDGAQLIATPEMTPLLQMDKARLLGNLHSPETDPALKAFRALARELGVFLLLGSAALKVGDKVANRSCLFGPNGKMHNYYDKIHLFDAQVSATERYRESSTYIAGNQAVIAHLPQVKLGLSICYDLRFPMLYRRYAQAGAQVVSVPASTGIITP